MSITFTQNALKEVSLVIQNKHLDPQSSYVRIQTLAAANRDGLNDELVKGPEFTLAVTPEYNEAVDWKFENNGFNVVADRENFESYNGVQVDFHPTRGFIFQKPVGVTCAVKTPTVCSAPAVGVAPAANCGCGTPTSINPTSQNSQLIMPGHNDHSTATVAAVGGRAGGCCGGSLTSEPEVGKLVERSGGGCCGG